jgi:N6-L-threonylcarbamoyladenine synthase
MALHKVSVLLKFKYMRLLAIETSCDETAVALLEAQSTKHKAQNFGLEILGNVVSSQEKIHAKYGGIVPEVAARRHIEMMMPVLDKAVGSDGLKNIDAIAVTAGPGLITSLAIGVETAKTLAITLNKPLIKVNHIEAHALSGLIDEIGDTTVVRAIKYPAICLVVSGGHTQIILIKKIGSYRIIGETLDDAAGEAFDKAAKILGLGYPGGPAISQSAAKGVRAKGKGVEVVLPRPMMNSKDFNFSFSGLKTAVLYKWQELSKGKLGKELEALKSAFAKEFQDAVVDVLVAKTLAAVEKYGAKTVMIGGGVSANKSLREKMAAAVEQKFGGAVSFVKPNIKYCTDNAAMVGFAALFRFQQGDFVNPLKFKSDPNWEL